MSQGTIRQRLWLLGGMVIVIGGLTGASCPAQSIAANFSGVTLNDAYALNNNHGGTPPDSMGAIGPDGFVEFVNGAFAVYSKAGARQTLLSDATFWTNSGIAAATLSPGLSDPRIVYDPASQRWFASEITTSNTANQVLIARSDTADPRGPWQAVHFTGNYAFADFDTLGVDATGVYIATNNFRNGTNPSVSLFSIPKTDLLAGAPTLARMTSFENLSGPTYGWALQGVTNAGPGPGHGVVIAIDYSRLQFFDRTTINGAGAANATLSSPVYVNHQYDAIPNTAQQPGGTPIDAAPGDSFGAAVRQVGNRIYMSNTILYNNRDAVHWLVLDETTNTLLGEGLIADPNFDFYQPSIAANANGVMVLGFNRSGAAGPAGNISTYAAVGVTNGTNITFGQPFLLAQGNVPNFNISWDTNAAKRWGDYSATTLDPTNSNLFWTIQEIPVDTQTWGTQITAILVPEPVSLSLLALTSLTLFSRRRSRVG